MNEGAQVTYLTGIITLILEKITLILEKILCESRVWLTARDLGFLL